MAEDFRQQSEFDMSFSYLNRLNNIMYIINESSLELNFWRWFHGLMVLYREVSTELKGDVNNILKPNKEDIKDEFIIVENKIADIERLLAVYQARGNNTNNQKLYKHLNVLDIFLRQILKKSGLLIKMRQDARFGLAQN